MTQERRPLSTKRWGWVDYEVDFSGHDEAAAAYKEVFKSKAQARNLPPRKLNGQFAPRRTSWLRRVQGRLTRRGQTVLSDHDERLLLVSGDLGVMRKMTLPELINMRAGHRPSSGVTAPMLANVEIEIARREALLKHKHPLAWAATKVVVGASSAVVATILSAYLLR